MAEHYASVYGTEKDKLNCPFYVKIGACRHGDRCSRIHNKPVFSQTILLQNLYLSPQKMHKNAISQGLPPPKISDEDHQNHFDDFFLDMLDEMSKHGSVESIFVCKNLSDHLSGNTYVKYFDEESASKALKSIEGRYYDGRIVRGEFSPVTDFREGKCRPFENLGMCERRDFCHFMHLYKNPTPQYSEDTDIQNMRTSQPNTGASIPSKNTPSYDGSKNSNDNRKDMEVDGAAHGSNATGNSQRGRIRERSPERYDSEYSRERKRTRNHSSRHRDRDRNRDRHRDRDRDRDRNKDRDRDREQDRDRYDRSRDRDRSRERDRDRYRGKDSYRDREGSYYRDREYGRDRRDREINREHGRPRERDLEWDDDKDKNQHGKQNPSGASLGSPKHITTNKNNLKSESIDKNNRTTNFTGTKAEVNTTPKIELSVSKDNNSYQPSKEFQQRSQPSENQRYHQNTDNNSQAGVNLRKSDGEEKKTAAEDHIYTNEGNEERKRDQSKNSPQSYRDDRHGSRYESGDTGTYRRDNRGWDRYQSNRRSYDYERRY